MEPDIYLFLRVDCQTRKAITGGKVSEMGDWGDFCPFLLLNVSCMQHA